MLVHHIITFLNACYRHKDRQYSRDVRQGCHHCIQGDNNNNERLKFQVYQTETMEGLGLKIIVRKQAQTINTTVEGIYIRGANK